MNTLKSDSLSLWLHWSPTPRWHDCTEVWLLCDMTTLKSGSSASWNHWSLTPWWHDCTEVLLFCDMTARKSDSLASWLHWSLTPCVITTRKSDSSASWLHWSRAPRHHDYTEVGLLGVMTTTNLQHGLCTNNFLRNSEFPNKLKVSKDQEHGLCPSSFSSLVVQIRHPTIV